MQLISNKTASARIVIAADAGKIVRFAADELAKYLNLMGGALLPVAEDTVPAEGAEIVIGKTSREGTPCGCGLKNDGYLLKTVGSTLFILGDNDRGCLYGVYGLLEKVLGCLFLAEGVEKIPTRGTVTLPELDLTVIPPLEYRETYWHCVEHFPITAAKRGFNGSYYNLVPGMDVHYFGFAHTLFSYVSPDEYFDTHPEYFAMVNGERLRERTQLCLTNPEVLEITKKKLRRNIIDHPECKIFSLTQMDWYNPCTCPECARVDEEEGAHSGTMLRFVNACAASIAEEFPDVIIDTFAYQYTRQAPKITKPLPNVCVRICSIECCFSHPLNECNEIVYPFKDKVIGNAHFQDDIRDWGKICSRMYVWDYTTNYRHYLAPFPNFHVLQSNMKFFLENGVKGIFEQGNAQSVSGEFGELRMYIISKLMWDPDTDVEEAMQEFLTGYYGMAAAPIREYIRMLTDHVVKDGVHMGIYDDPRWYITDETLDKAEALWNEAETLAADDAELARIRRSRLQVRYANIVRMADNDPARSGLVDALVEDAKAFGITNFRESRPMDQTAELLRVGGPYR